jgi:transcriptional regulator with XRE-family HTH domain
MPSSDKPGAWLGRWAEEGVGRVAERAAMRDAFLASALAEFQRRRDWSPEELADFVGISPGQLAKLALCRRPDPNSQKFASDIQQIAFHCGADPGRLQQILEERGIARIDTGLDLPFPKLPAAEYEPAFLFHKEPPPTAQPPTTPTSESLDEITQELQNFEVVLGNLLVQLESRVEQLKELEPAQTLMLQRTLSNLAQDLERIRRLISNQTDPG